MKSMKSMLILWIVILSLASLDVAAQVGPLAFDKSEYAARRERLMAQIPDGIAIIWGAQAGLQTNDFNYLCGVKIPRAVLIVDGLNKESTLFYTTRERTLRANGFNVELASDPKGFTGVEKYERADRFTPTLDQLTSQTNVIYTPFRDEEAYPELGLAGREWREWDGRLTRTQQFVKLLRERYPKVQVRDLNEKLWELRRIKSPAEVEVLREASKLSERAMIEIMKAVHPNQYEYELSALFEYVIKREGARDVFDYGVIISSAENHPFLHYNAHNRLLVDGDFVVFDCGADYHDYDSDISISFPVNGKFSPRQREIYEACNEVSKACLKYYKPGVTAFEVGAKVREELQAKGIDLTKDAYTRLQYFNMGGMTHYVGLATHDAGGTDVPKDQPLKAGMVFASDVFATFPDENLGVRVENIVLVTETGCENLTSDLPREISEIEALMSDNTPSVSRGLNNGFRSFSHPLTQQIWQINDRTSKTQDLVKY